MKLIRALASLATVLLPNGRCSLAAGRHRRQPHPRGQHPALGRAGHQRRHPRAPGRPRVGVLGTGRRLPGHRDGRRDRRPHRPFGRLDRTRARHLHRPTAPGPRAGPLHRRPRHRHRAGRHPGPRHSRTGSRHRDTQCLHDRGPIDGCVDGGIDGRDARRPTTGSSRPARSSSPRATASGHWLNSTWAAENAGERSPPSTRDARCPTAPSSFAPARSSRGGR